jgi:hypothetical protein
MLHGWGSSSRSAKDIERAFAPENRHEKAVKVRRFAGSVMNTGDANRRKRHDERRTDDLTEDVDCIRNGERVRRTAADSARRVTFIRQAVGRSPIATGQVADEMAHCTCEDK